MSKLLKITKDFVAIKSTELNKKGLQEAINLAKNHLADFQIEEFEKNDIKSLLVYNSKERPKKFEIILNGHLDVIPGKEDQFIPKEKDDKLYGVGAMDMKGGLVCLIEAFKEVAGKVDYPLGLQLTTDEEVGGFNGTKHQISKGVEANFVITGEPTNLNIVNRAKGVLWAKVRAKGKTAHGAYPWNGDNAVLKMANFIKNLENLYKNPDKEEWITTINYSDIKTTNEARNKIPDRCILSLDIRYVPGDKDTIIEKIKSIMPEDFDLEVIAFEPSLNVSEQNKYVQKIIDSTTKITGKKPILYGANGSSDARHYSEINVDGVEFGPIGGNISQDDEWLDIKSLDSYKKIIVDFLLNLNS